MSFINKVIGDKYNKEGALPGPHQLVEFESDMITLDIPTKGTTINGWKIIPLIRPVVSSCEYHIHPALQPPSPQPVQVTKKQVDNFREGKSTPCCQVKAKVSDRRKKIPTLIYQISLQGAKYPYNFVTIELSARGTCTHWWLNNVCSDHFHTTDTTSSEAAIKRSLTFGDLAAGDSGTPFHLQSDDNK